MSSYEKVYLTQGGEEWHNARRMYANASQAGAIMGVGKYHPRNMAELLAVQRGDATVYQTKAMTRGNELEPVAMASLSDQVGVQFSPCVMRYGRFQASLDGLDFTDAIGAEVKCPVSADSPLLDVRSPPDLLSVMPQYFWQVVAQFYAAGLSDLYWYAYHPQRAVAPVRFTRDDVAGHFDAWVGKATEYLKHLDDGTSPETERSDPEWQQAVAGYMQAKAAVEAAEANLEACRSTLIALGGGKGFGLSVVRVKGRKTTDYAKAMKQYAPDADLSAYVKEGQPTWRITEAK